MKDKTESKMGDFIYLMFVGIIFITGISIGRTIGEKGSLINMNNNISLLSKCCPGSSCTDTYIGEDGLCHLVLCENNWLNFNKSECTYKPIDIP